MAEAGKKSDLRKYIGDPTNAADYVPDETAKKELLSFESNSIDYDTDSKKLKNERYKQNTTLRSDLAVIFTVIIFGWLFCVIMTLWNNSFFKLSDSVLITLLTTTTIQVLGMMLIILKDLFPGGNDEQ